jgi:hypothetical protein
LIEQDGYTPHEDFEVDAPVALTQVPPVDPQSAYLENLFDLALRGELPRYRELRPWEPKTLQPQHLEWILMRSAGARNQAIASFFGASDATVSIVLRHPDAKYLLSRLAVMRTEGMTDISKRLEALEPLAVDALADVLVEGKEENRVKVAFGVLGRRYGPTKQHEHKVTHEFAVPKKSADLLRTALVEGREIPQNHYADFIAEAVVVESGPPGGEGNLTDGGKSSQNGSLPPATSPQADSRVA